VASGDIKEGFWGTASREGEDKDDQKKRAHPSREQLKHLILQKNKKEGLRKDFSWKNRN